MRAALLTREYPPEVYGGAGVHVEYLGARAPRSIDVDVHAWGADRDGRRSATTAWDALAGQAPQLAALRAMSIDLTMAAGVDDADVVHSHTWYANLGGHLAKLVHDIPHVVTVHSLEPLRPWKAEQLGGGYALSSFCERTAVEAADAIVAVSDGMAVDLLTAYPAIDPGRVSVIYNGIDTEEYAPDPGTDVLERHGIDPAAPTVVFVGRITRQKGVAHLLEAMRHVDAEAQLVLCAGAPDTPEIGAEVARRVEELQAQRGNVLWLERDAAQARRDPDPQPRDGLRVPVDLRAAGHRQPRGDGLRDGRRGHGRPAASSRSSTTASPACSSPSSRATTPPASRATRPPSPPRSPRGSTRSSAIPQRAAEMGRAGRAPARVERFAWPAIAQETREALLPAAALQRRRANSPR